MDFNNVLNYTIALASIVIGILVSVYFYRKAKEEKEPRLYYQTYPEIEKISGEAEAGDIKLFYKNVEVNRVSTSYVWFWNQGRKPILKADVPASSELKITLISEQDDIKILDHKIITQSRNPINVSVLKVDGKTLKLDFEFLDYMDGWAMEIQHTGGIDTKFGFDGIILGCSKGVDITDPSEYVKTTGSRFPRGVIPTLAISMFACILFCFGAIIPVFLSELNTDTPGKIVLTPNELGEVIRAKSPDLQSEIIESILQEAGARTIFNNKLSTEIIIYALVFFMIITCLGGFIALPILLTFYSQYPFPENLTFESGK